MKKVFGNIPVEVKGIQCVAPDIKDNDNNEEYIKGNAIQRLLSLCTIEYMSNDVAGDE